MHGAGMLDTEEVTGSNPVSPTIDMEPLTMVTLIGGCFLIRGEAEVDLFRAAE